MVCIYRNDIIVYICTLYYRMYIYINVNIYIYIHRFCRLKENMEKIGLIFLGCLLVES